MSIKGGTQIISVIRLREIFIETVDSSTENLSVKSLEEFQ